MKHVVLYVGHLYKLFWTKKIDRVGKGGSKKAKIWPRMGLAFIYFWPRSLLEAPKCVKFATTFLFIQVGIFWSESTIFSPFESIYSPLYSILSPQVALFSPAKPLFLGIIGKIFCSRSGGYSVKHPPNNFWRASWGKSVVYLGIAFLFWGCGGHRRFSRWFVHIAELGIC